MLGAQNSAQALSFLLAGTKGAGDLHGYGGLGKVDREVGDLADDKYPLLAAPELVIEPFPLTVCGRALDDRRTLQLSGHLVELIEVGADDEYLVVRVLVDDATDYRQLCPRG